MQDRLTKKTDRTVYYRPVRMLSHSQTCGPYAARTICLTTVQDEQVDRKVEHTQSLQTAVCESLSGHEYTDRERESENAEREVSW